MSAYSQEEYREAGRRGGLASSRIRYRSLIDPTLESTKAGIRRMHVKRGFPLEAIEKINNEVY